MSCSKFAYKKLALSVMLASGVLAGCSDSDGIPPKTGGDQTPPPAAKTIVNPVSLIFQSIDGAFFIDQAFEFSLKGAEIHDLFVQGAELVSTENNIKKYKANSGTISISRESGANPEAFTLELHATAPGFFATGADILIPAQSKGRTGKEGASYDVIFTPLTPANDQVAITATEKEFEAAGGVVPSESGKALIIATEPPEDNAPNQGSVGNSKVALTIPPGTQLKNKDGELVEGNITANIVYFSNEAEGSGSSESALEAFPGGLSPSSILDENGVEGNPEYQDVTFISAGFTAIQLQNEDGEVVSEFSQQPTDDPITLAFDVSTKTRDLDGNLIRPGDTIPVWSYNENTGRWKAEGEAKVGPDNGNGTYTVTQTITHLSYYNLDYKGQRCRANVTFEEVNGNDYNPRVIFTRAGGGWTNSRYIWGMETHEFGNIPSQGEGTFQVVSRGRDNRDLIESAEDSNGNSIDVIDNKISHNFCELDGATVRIKSPKTQELGISLQSKCEDNGVIKEQPGMVQVYGKNYYGYYGTVTPTVGSPGVMYLEEGDYLLVGRIYTEDYGWQMARDNISMSNNTDVTLTFPIDECGTTTTGTTGTTGASGGSGG